MKIDVDVVGDLLVEAARDWYPAQELNQLLLASAPVDELYWRIDGIYGWELLETVPQIADVLAQAAQRQVRYQIEDEAPVTKYAQGICLEDGTFTVELAVVANMRAYNMRIGATNDPDALSSAPDAPIPNAQALTQAQAYEVLAGWASGQGLPPGYGGTIHVYG